jgi:hypothetical protein
MFDNKTIPQKKYCLVIRKIDNFKTFLETVNQQYRSRYFQPGHW